MIKKIVPIFLLAIFYLPLIQQATGFVQIEHLQGVTHTQKRPAFSLKDVRSGTFQKEFSNWFGEVYGFRDLLVQINNQFLYDVFAEAGPTGEAVVIGKDGNLYTLGYIHSYLQLFPPMNLSGFRTIAQTLKDVQTLLAVRGIHFLVLITPNKASLYPEGIPETYTRFLRAVPNYHYWMFVDALRAEDVTVVDGHALLSALKKSSDRPVYPRGGIHWNEWGMFHVLQSLVAQMESMTKKKMGVLSLEECLFDNHPTGTDRDILNILNLLSPPDDYPVAHIKIKKTDPPRVFRPSVLMVGGSYNYPLCGLLTAHEMVSRLDFFNYYNWVVHYPDPTLTHIPLDRLDWDKDVFNRDIIVLEINEEYITDNISFVGNGFVSDLLIKLQKRDQPTKR